MFPFLSFLDIPMSGRFRHNVNDEMVVHDLEFLLCNTCGLVRQVSFDRPQDYTDINRPTTSQLPDYTNKLLSQLKERGVGSDDLIIEVGSNDGTFLKVLQHAGFNNLVGVEPSRRLSEIASNDGFRMINDYFSPALAEILKDTYGYAKAIICRHTLEHVPEPDVFVSGFLKCFNEKEGLVLIDVPDGAAIPELLNVYELWDEHLFYFSVSNLSIMLENAGLGISSHMTYPHLETRNLVLWCMPGKKPYPDAVKPSQEIVRLWQSFCDQWEQYKQALKNALIDAPQPIYFAGASHSQTNLINYTGIAPLVDFLIDDAPDKTGSFAPIKGEGSGIITTNDFERTATKGTVVLSGFGYPRWMERLKIIADKGSMKMIDPNILKEKTKSD